MKETEKRIEAYKKALPEIREKVLAVALLLVMSIAMMTSATFAWLTISRAPEVTEVSTTVAANGNLEIALATGDGKTAPVESQVGDSSANEKQSVTGANITWGNLVNLSDPSYGLENLTLRPAQLNTASLLDSPLYGAVYANDGRITQLTSNFGYATWNLPEGDKPGYFGVSDGKGVRAISSTKIEAVGAEALYVKMVEDAKNTNLAAANMYVGLGNNDKYMPSLATMMGLYMTARMNPDHATLSNPDCAIADIQNLRDMYAAFLEAFDKEAEAMAALVNLQLFLLEGEGEYEPYTANMIYGTTTAALKIKGVQISNLEQFIKDRNTIAADYQKLVEICSSGTSLKWKDSGLNGIVNNLVNVGACTIGADNTPISSIGASNAMSYLSGTQEARITNGILYRFEERTGGYIEVKNLGISATVNRMGMTIPATVKANIQTTAPRDYNLFNNDLKYAESLNTGDYKGGIAVAQDTYGLAVDLWVRTNAEGSYLTLEGNVLTEKGEEQPVTGKDPSGNIVDIYVLTVSGVDEDGKDFSYTIDAYLGKTQVIDEQNQTITEVDAWIDAEKHDVVEEVEYDSANLPPRKMYIPINITGFEGENRVWNDVGAMLSTDATTQGSGSCYVYYADTPEDQARSLKLLEAFNVAFVDDEGKLMATAIMDTERYFAESGRVIVPLVLSTSDSINLGEDSQGNITYAITTLEKNVPTRITAIVYLDGTKLTNEQVLAASDIQGKLNIQFGSNFDMQPIDNEELQNKTRSVSAAVNPNTFDFAKSDEIPMTTTVTVRVDGDAPNTVTAFFMREISPTQGSREEAMDFTKNEDGSWTADYTFHFPGKYILRTVTLDGVDYDLASPPEVNIEGFTVASLSYQNVTTSEENANHINVMTAASSTTAGLSLKFAGEAGMKMPSSVQGRFIKAGDNSAVNVDFSYNPTTTSWDGTATFLSSGDYTMEYIVVDGEYMYLDAAYQKTATVTLGMKVAVYTTSPHSFKYVPSEMADNEKLLGMQVMIMDNEENGLPGLSGVKLSYGMKGSGIKKMDADLTWNGSYYVGELTTTGPGIWQFSNVVVGSNTLTSATTAPTFTILSPEPPEYYAHSTVAYQYKPNNDAVMNAQITNSAAATVQALIVKSDGTEKWVDGTVGGELTTTDGKTANHWNFLVPTDDNGYQDGNWTLTALRLWNVFAADGTEYTEKAPLIIDVSDTNNVTKVVARINVTFAQGQSKDFGKDASGNVTATFMTSHTIGADEPLNVDIKDFEGQPIVNANGENVISDVQLIFTYGNNSKTYGGYESASLTNAVADFTIALNDDGTHTHFAQNGNQTIQYAGSWKTTLSFKVNGTEYRYGDDGNPNTTENDILPNTPQFTVSSVKPTVTITDITMDGAGAYSVDLNKTGSLADSSTYKTQSGGCITDYIYTCTTNKDHIYAANNTQYLSRIETGGKTAWIYFKCNHDDVATYSGGTKNGPLGADFKGHTYLYNNGEGVPKATLTLNGMGNATGATLEFAKTGGGDVIMITQYTADRSGGTYWGNYSQYGTSSYTWSADGTCFRFIGVMDNGAGENSSDTKTVADTITASTLVMTYNNVEYSFTIPTITINNPY